MNTETVDIMVDAVNVGIGRVDRALHSIQGYAAVQASSILEIGDTSELILSDINNAILEIQNIKMNFKGLECGLDKLKKDMEGDNNESN